MHDNYVLESLASDLKRVALGLHRGSNIMADRFLDEALKRKSEIEMKNLSPYIQNLLKRLSKNIDAEDALMYSTIIQNYTRYKKSSSF
ncbi:hypothetical protein A3I56_03845 [Candidatus Roizmanbacteria bacterium RIFCSPLOWO2_02_FULL_43_10]|uniref:Uncharacterized protein n=1 Tax=Candidatus Roizmanbacteria bacterium RIFCSPLOWO2_02_FULL_43_10 TaxID=1802078 RepID=A0A1F7K011_9BACT|nr:MAG: hypothetical protein A3I56_03845 [Candidatus Roizmanbacteria bacterium RIFCSPLOWO2_02_FULL_43_10]